MLIQQRRDCAG